MANSDQKTTPDCLACAVRQLTEGQPEIWHFQEEGEGVSGIVLKVGEQDTPFGMIPFVDLWLGGMDRVRVMAYGQHLAGQMTSQELKVGDRVTIVYEGHRVVEKGRHAGSTYRVFQVTVERGHH